MSKFRLVTTLLTSAWLLLGARAIRAETPNDTSVGNGPESTLVLYAQAVESQDLPALEALHTEDFVYQTKSGSAEPQSHSRIEELAGWRKLFSSGATMRIRFQRAEEYASTQVADGVWRISGLQMSSSVSYTGPNGQPTESTVSAPSVTFWVRMISADPKSFAIYRIESVL